MSNRSVLDVAVSYFDSYTARKPRSVNLLDWLCSNQYAERILKLRRVQDKRQRGRIKADLPAVTVSGLFYPRRKAECLVQHSGLICIDIDYKDNRHIGNYDQLKEELFKIEHIAYAGLSASGKGYFLIIPILYPKYHALHYNALYQDFKSLGIIIDKAPKSVVSLRGCSYDTSHLFRKKVITYSNLLYSRVLLGEKNRSKKSMGVGPGPYLNAYPRTTRDKVESMIHKLLQNGIDITAKEPEWFIIACAIANEFGESGRGYYHMISQLYSGYNTQETNRKYNNALRKKYHKIGIGSFFRIASQYL